MSTYTPIASQTLSSAIASVTFGGIPQNYTDLVLVINAKAGASDNPIYMRLNGDSASNYSAIRLYGTGSSATSNRTSNNTAMFPSWFVAPATGNFSQNSITNIMNYSNSTTYKTVTSRANEVGQGAEANVALWRSTSAITSIELSLSATTFSSGSTFNLYGIQGGGPKAGGGNNVSTDGTYWYHAFTSSGVFTPAQALTADFLVIAGGGGAGAANYAGGGGAGGLRGFASQSLTTTVYTVTVGSGGTGSAGGTRGTSGVNSSISGTGFTTITSTGGGGGGADNNSSSGIAIGLSGGSGGGNYNNATSAGGAGNAGSYSPVEGYAGGSGGGSGPGGGGGGGGAAEAGNTDGQSNGGDGSSAYSSWGLVTGTGENISGTVYYAGGGGGGAGATYVGGQNTATLGGDGGGGRGGGYNVNNSTAGLTNTGGGGGGVGGTSGDSRGGGSGIVIVRYLA